MIDRNIKERYRRNRLPIARWFPWACILIDEDGQRHTGIGRTKRGARDNAIQQWGKRH